MTILVLGGDSALGSQIIEDMRKKNKKIITTTRRIEKTKSECIYLDMEKFNIEEIKSIINGIDIEAVIICFGETRLNECQKNPARTREINVNAISDIYEVISQFGIFTVFLSTDRVFSGKNSFEIETAEKTPVSQYGIQKRDCEDKLKEIDGENLAILRMSKVISRRYELIDNWIFRITNNRSIYAYNDMSICPVYVDSAINMIIYLIKRKKSGEFHLSGEKDISYYEFAKELSLKLNIKARIIKHSYTLNKQITYPVPRYTSLKNSDASLERFNGENADSLLTKYIKGSFKEQLRLRK